MTGDEPQGTMERVKLSPSRLLLRAHFHRERERRLGKRQVVSSGLKLEKMSPGTKQTVRIKRVYVKRALTVLCPNSGIFILSRSVLF